MDDASADPGAIAAIAAAHGARVIRRPVNGGPGAARNTGLAAASTELVAFLDSDCVPEPGWLDRLLPHFADPAVGAVAPRIVPHQAGASWLARYEGASSTLDMGARPSIVRPGARVSYVPGAALVVRRAAAGAGFADGMFVGEDVDFIWRLSAAGWRVRYEPSATMGHDHRVRFRAWFSRRADYGTSAAALEQLHPGAVRPLYASWWTVGAWAAALSGRPVAAAGLTAAATALLARRLSTVTGETWPLPAPPPPDPDPTYSITARSVTRRSAQPTRRAEAWRLAARLAGGGTLAAARPIGSALSRTWWPLAIPAAIAFPRLRRPVAALILAPAAARLGRPPPAARPGPLRRRPPARRRRLQPRRLAGLPQTPHDRPAASHDRRQATAERLTAEAGYRSGERHDDGPLCTSGCVQRSIVFARSRRRRITARSASGAAYGVSRLGPRKRNIASLIESSPSSVISRRPRPRPNPPCGGQPYLKLFR